MPPKKGPAAGGSGRRSPTPEEEEGEVSETSTSPRQGFDTPYGYVPQQGRGRRKVVLLGTGPSAGAGPSNGPSNGPSAGGSGSCRVGGNRWIQDQANKLKAKAQENARGLNQPPQHVAGPFHGLEEAIQEHKRKLTIKRQPITGIEHSEYEQRREKAIREARIYRERIRRELTTPPKLVTTTEMYRFHSERIDILKKLIDERLKRIKIDMTGQSIDKQNRSLVWGDPDRPVVLTKTILDAITFGATPNNIFIRIDVFIEMLEEELRDFRMNQQADTPLLNWVRTYQGKVQEITVSDPADISNLKKLTELNAQLKEITLKIKTSCIDPELDKPSKSIFERMHDKVSGALKKGTDMELFVGETAMATHNMWNMYIDVYDFFGQDVGTGINTYGQMKELTDKIEKRFIAIIESLILICGTISLMNPEYRAPYMEIIRAIQPISDTALVVIFSPLMGHIVGELISESCSIVSKTTKTVLQLKRACIDHANTLKENTQVLIDILFDRDTDKRNFYEALEFNGDMAPAFPMPSHELERYSGVTMAAKRMKLGALEEEAALLFGMQGSQESTGSSLSTGPGQATGLGLSTGPGLSTGLGQVTGSKQSKKRRKKSNGSGSGRRGGGTKRRSRKHR